MSPVSLLCTDKPRRNSETRGGCITETLLTSFFLFITVRVARLPKNRLDLCSTERLCETGSADFLYLKFSLLAYVSSAVGPFSTPDAVLFHLHTARRYSADFLSLAFSDPERAAKAL